MWSGLHHHSLPSSSPRDVGVEKSKQNDKEDASLSTSSTGRESGPKPVRQRALMTLEILMREKLLHGGGGAAREALLERGNFTTCSSCSQVFANMELCSNCLVHIDSLRETLGRVIQERLRQTRVREECIATLECALPAGRLHPLKGERDRLRDTVQRLRQRLESRRARHSQRTIRYELKIEELRERRRKLLRAALDLRASVAAHRKLCDDTVFVGDIHRVQTMGQAGQLSFIQSKLVRRLLSFFKVNTNSILDMALPPRQHRGANIAKLPHAGTALGCVVRLLQLLSQYMQVPLPYRLIHAGSRSEVEATYGSGRYPLYPGMDADGFYQGLMLLEQSVCWLCETQRVATYVKDVPHLLGNIVRLRNHNWAVNAERRLVHRGIVPLVGSLTTHAAEAIISPQFLMGLNSTSDPSARGSPSSAHGVSPRHASIRGAGSSVAGFGRVPSSPDLLGSKALALRRHRRQASHVPSTRPRQRGENRSGRNRPMHARTHSHSVSMKAKPSAQTIYPDGFGTGGIAW